MIDSVYDKGFLYRDENMVFRFLCLPAESALMRVFADNVPLPPLYQKVSIILSHDVLFKWNRLKSKFAYYESGMVKILSFGCQK